MILAAEPTFDDELMAPRAKVGPKLKRPRAGNRLRPHLVHTELLRPNEFTTSTIKYRTYGAQWVLTNQRKDGVVGGLLQAEVARERAPWDHEDLMNQTC